MKMFPIGYSPHFIISVKLIGFGTGNLPDGPFGHTSNAM